jgi:hypothetical protein
LKFNISFQPTQLSQQESDQTEQQSRIRISNELNPRSQLRPARYNSELLPDNIDMSQEEEQAEKEREAMLVL